MEILVPRQHLLRKGEGLSFILEFHVVQSSQLASARLFLADWSFLEFPVIRLAFRYQPELGLGGSGRSE